MLIGRPYKRTLADQFKHDARLDLFDGEEAVGGLVYAVRAETASIELKGETYTAARARPRMEGKAAYQALIRLARGAEKPPPNPIRLANAAGVALGSADGKRSPSDIAFGEASYALRRRSMFSRRYDLHPVGAAAPLGSVGPPRMLSTSLTADFPPDVPMLLQAFLFALMLDMTFAALENSSS